MRFLLIALLLFSLTNISMAQSDTSKESDGEVFKVVEQMPRFPGCEDLPESERRTCSNRKMLEFLYSNLNYPAEATEKNIHGTNIMQFIVGTDGKITNIEILKDIGGGTANAGIDVIQAMPDWIPGKQRGKEVAVQISLPIKFSLPRGAASEQVDGKKSKKAKKKNKN